MSNRVMATAFLCVAAVCCNGDGEATGPEDHPLVIPDIGGAWVVEFTSAAESDRGAACTIRDLHISLDRHTSALTLVGTHGGLHIECSGGTPPLDTLVESPPGTVTAVQSQSCVCWTGPCPTSCDDPYDVVEITTGPLVLKTWLSEGHPKFEHPDTIGPWWGSYQDPPDSNQWTFRVIFDWRAVREGAPVG